MFNYCKFPLFIELELLTRKNISLLKEQQMPSFRYEALRHFTIPIGRHS